MLSVLVRLLIHVIQQQHASIAMAMTMTMTMTCIGLSAYPKACGLISLLPPRSKPRTPMRKPMLLGTRARPLNSPILVDIMLSDGSG